MKNDFWFFRDSNSPTHSLFQKEIRFFGDLDSPTYYFKKNTSQNNSEIQKLEIHQTHSLTLTHFKQPAT